MICPLPEKFVSYAENGSLIQHISETLNRLDEAFMRLKPDFVLLDINLPHHDGFYWCEKIMEPIQCSHLVSVQP